MDFDFEWFKNVIKPKLIQYKLNFDRLNSDSGLEYIDRVEIQGNQLGGEIMFYNDGRIYVFLYHHINEKILLNTMIDSQDEKEKEEVLMLLQKLL